MNAEKIFGKNVYVNLDEVIETVYQCRRDVANDEWVKRWFEPLTSLTKIEVSEDCISRGWALEKLHEKYKFNRFREHNETANIGIYQAESIVQQAPSVVPKRSCYRCGLREDCEDSTERR